MSTRSTIAVAQPDGKVKSIYCHWDGYPSHNGKMLLENYNSSEKANELIALGGLSALCKNLTPSKDSIHSFETPQEDVTIAYHRDRGEEFSQQQFKSLEDYEKNNDSQQYNYIFKKHKWYVNGKLLTKKMITEQ